MGLKPIQLVELNFTNNQYRTIQYFIMFHQLLKLVPPHVAGNITDWSDDQMTLEHLISYDDCTIANFPGLGKDVLNKINEACHKNNIDWDLSTTLEHVKRRRGENLKDILEFKKRKYGNQTTRSS